MKNSVVALAALAQLSSAHYFFDVNVINGSPGRPFEYIRDFTRQTKFNPIKFSSNPPEDIRDGSHADGDDIICNQGAFTNAGSTDVLTISAGDSVRAQLGVGASMEHPGPGFVYMSRAPGDDVKTYDGAGDWFKIFEEGVCNESGDFTTDAWCTWGRNFMEATIPEDTPDGEYLVRFEHIGVHRSHVNQPEHYVSCMQVKVENGGSGTPGPTFELPGGYKVTDDYANMNIYNGIVPFTFPGPAVWSGGAGSGGNGSNDGGDNNGGGDSGNDNDSGAGGDDSGSDGDQGDNDGGSGDGGSDGGNNGPCSGMWEQCGGIGFNGPTCCSTGSCGEINEYYFQCT